MSKLTKNQIEINEDAIKMASDNTWYFYYKFLEDDYTISFKNMVIFLLKNRLRKSMYVLFLNTESRLIMSKIRFTSNIH